MKRYEVEVEVTQTEWFEVDAANAEEAEENYDDGDQVRMDIDDRTVVSVEEMETVLCTCGHPYDEHQTGSGPWTGFCGNTECKCEDPTEDE